MVRRLLFQRSGGYWLFWTSAVYLIVGLYSAFFHKEIPTHVIQIIWIAFLALPFTYPPLGRWLNLDVRWDENMLDFFKNRNSEKNNVVDFPKLVEPVQPVAQPPKKKEPKEHYRVGFNDEGMTTLTLMSSGSSMTLSMSQDACELMIRMLRATYQNNFNPDDDPDGGLPLPAEDKKVA